MLTAPTFWLVLLVAVPVFWNLPKGWRYGFLGFVSLGYLATLSWRSMALLVPWMVLFYLVAPLAARGRPYRLRALWSLVLASLALLSAFKYLPAIVERAFTSGLTGKVAIPLGISYYTFKLIHYAAEVARGTVPARSFQQFFSYIFLFPIFTAGPIQRFDHFLQGQEERWSLDSAVAGLRRIVHGLIKKFVCAWFIAERCFEGEVADENLGFLIDHLSPTMTFAYLVAIYLYIYFDFSA